MPLRWRSGRRKEIHYGDTLHLLFFCALHIVFFCFIVQENIHYGENNASSVECFSPSIRSPEGGSTPATTIMTRTVGRRKGLFGLDRRVAMGVTSRPPYFAETIPNNNNDDNNRPIQINRNIQDDEDFILFEEDLTNKSIEQRIVEQRQRNQQQNNMNHYDDDMPWGSSLPESSYDDDDDDDIVEEGNDDDTDEEDERQLSDEQARALSLIKDGRNVFLTGVAGTGKSLVLKKALEHIKENFDYNEYVALAPTGSTAVGLEGQTVHSFAGIGIPKIYTDFRKMKSNKKIRKRWENLKVLLVDEVSMISGEFFDSLSRIVSEIRKDPRPFGGIQLIVCGDFLQLSPIAPRKWEVDQMVHGIREKEGLATVEEARNWLFLNRGFCFQSEAWKASSFETVELKHVFRQSNRDFVNILQDIRLGNVTSETVRYLRENCERPLPQNDFGIQPTILHSKNINVARENLVDLEKLAGETVTFKALDKVEREKGVGKWVDKDLSNNSFFKTCTAEKHLSLKLGAQVMLIKNIGSHSSMLTNGSRGTIVGFRAVKKSSEMNLLPGVKKYPVVRFKNGLQMVITPQKFQSRILGMGTCTRTAIPLKLAWAITTHKAQGMTMDYVIADVGQVFAEAQLYVALSRVSDETGLELRNFSESRVKANPLALKFHKDPSLQYPNWWDLDGSDPKIMSETEKHIRVEYSYSFKQESRRKHPEHVLDESILKKQTLPELKQMLRERGLNVSGKKADLIERLTSVDESSANLLPTNDLAADKSSSEVLFANRQSITELSSSELPVEKFSSIDLSTDESSTEDSTPTFQNPFWWLADDADPNMISEESRTKSQVVKKQIDYSETIVEEQILKPNAKPNTLNQEIKYSETISEEPILEAKPAPLDQQQVNSSKTLPEEQILQPKPKVVKQQIEFSETISGEQNLKKRTVVELKQMLSERGLKVSGRKIELIQRLNQPMESYETLSEEEKLKKHTVLELKQMLRERGLKVSGRKAELIDRLMPANGSLMHASSSPSTRNEVAKPKPNQLSKQIDYSEPVLEEQNLKKHTVVELKQMLRDRNLKVSGKKSELISRLTSADEYYEQQEEETNDVIRTEWKKHISTTIYYMRSRR